MSQPLLPGATIGILGGGQLGRMLTDAAHRMGYHVVVWSGAPDAGPAAQADMLIEEPFDDTAAFERFVRAAAVATVEFENIPRALLEAIAGRIPLHPGANAIAICQDREREKTFLSDHGVPCAPFAVVSSAAELREALATLPSGGGILKTAEFGYDGKGQVVVSASGDAEAIWASFAAPRGVLEQKIDLAAEFSVLVARDASGATAVYDPVQNDHRDHILDLSVAPAALPPALFEQSQRIARTVATDLAYVGLLAIEFFVSRSGELLVNEMAPRPHNSGHHTINACVTSQFEQQLRAICGLPLGDPKLLQPAAMINLLGDVWIDHEGRPDWTAMLAIPGCSLHLYGKTEPRRGRKMGHLTILAETPEEVWERQAQCRELLGLPQVEPTKW
jgi:5-(carboxyamino)imidazole ribonucleotide synthase